MESGQGWKLGEAAAVAGDVDFDVYSRMVSSSKDVVNVVDGGSMQNVVGV